MKNTYHKNILRHIGSHEVAHYLLSAQQRLSFPPFSQGPSLPAPTLDHLIGLGVTLVTTSEGKKEVVRVALANRYMETLYDQWFAPSS